uniref:LEM domain-containing protein n=1 Tax=Timema tahoe TaxID=61484 RepID=A0A7R9IJ57_9NEOP|nr:unnamed protein product [Timema tahoe]
MKRGVQGKAYGIQNELEHQEACLSADHRSDDCSSSIASSVPASFVYDSDVLYGELKRRGLNPGPITHTTKKVYLRKLYHLQKHDTVAPTIVNTTRDLDKLLEHLMSRIVKCDVMNSANTSKKWLAVDLKKQSNMKSLPTVDIEFAASTALKGIKDIKILQFRGDCKKFLVDFCNKLLHKCPLSYKIVKGASCLSPAVMINPSVRTYRITSTLEVLLDKKQLSSVQADVVKRDYLDFVSKQDVIDYLKQFTSSGD